MLHKIGRRLLATGLCLSLGAAPAVADHHVGDPAAGSNAAARNASTGTAGANSMMGSAMMGGAMVDSATVDRMLANWPNRPKLAAVRMLDKYGSPNEATEGRLIWHNKGPWKRIMVVREEIPHQFPRLHMDFLYQTINYQVPPGRSDELIAFDGSVLVDRTAGHLTARCDLEEANILTLNLAHNIATGRMNVEQARKAFALAETQLLNGQRSPLVNALQFPVPVAPPMDPDKPEIPGSPVASRETTALALQMAVMPPPARAPLVADTSMPGGMMANGMPTAGLSDPEIMAFNATLDLNEIEAALDAEKKATSPQVRQFAQMIHMHHGKDLTAAMMLAARMRVAPLWTPAVDLQNREAAGKLAQVVRLDGPEFDRAWINLQVEEHAKSLAMIDGQLMPAAKNRLLREHLTQTRAAVAAHLEEARRLQAAMAR